MEDNKGIKEQLGEWAKKILIEHVWPGVKKEIEAECEKLGEYIVERSQKILKAKFDNWKIKKEEKRKQAEALSKEFQTKMVNATDQSEVEKYKAISEVWKEIAEGYRLEIEELKNDKAEIKKELNNFDYNEKKHIDSIVASANLPAIIKKFDK